MHQHVGAIRSRCHSQDVRISSATTHVVEPLGSRRQGRCRHRCPIGVHRQQCLRMSVADRPHHRHHPLYFCLFADPLRTRPAALAAHVQQVGPLGQQALRLGQGRFWALEKTAIAEGIGRHIEDAHHQGAARLHLKKPGQTRDSSLEKRLSRLKAINARIAA